MNLKVRRRKKSKKVQLDFHGWWTAPWTNLKTFTESFSTHIHKHPGQFIHSDWPRGHHMAMFKRVIYMECLNIGVMRKLYAYCYFTQNALIPVLNVKTFSMRAYASMQFLPFAKRTQITWEKPSELFNRLFPTLRFLSEGHLWREKESFVLLVNVYTDDHML